MFKNFSVSVRLLMLVICISLVSVVVGFMGLRGMTQAIASFNFVNTDHLVHLRDLKIISDQYSLNIVDATHKVRAGQLSWADAQKKLAQARSTVKEKWAAHPTDDFVGEELKLVTSIEAAFAKGAVAAIVDRPVDVPHVLVKDTTAALHALAHAARDRAIEAVRIGITGSVGKSTTTEVVSAMLMHPDAEAVIGKLGRTVRNMNNHDGLPLVVLRWTVAGVPAGA